MNYVFLLSNTEYVQNNIAKLKNAFPSIVDIFCKEGKYRVRVKSDKVANEKQAEYLVQRELNRIYFIAGVTIDLDFDYFENEDGSMVVRKDLSLSAMIVNELPANLAEQKWKYPLSIQLELWKIAHLDNVPLMSKVNLLFQIIEAAYPEQNNYPEYLDISVPPDPKTECKLLRHLVSHQGEVTKTQLKTYCGYLGYPESYLDPGDKEFHGIIKGKINLMRREARNAINGAISL